MDNIKEEIIYILKEKIHCACVNIENNLDAPLTGNPFYMTHVDMVYLLFEIEKKFKIRMKENDLISYGFSTINRIIHAIELYGKENEL